MWVEVELFLLGPRHSRWAGGSAPRPGRLYPRERPGTHFTGDWVGPRAGLDGQKISSPPGFFFRSRTVQPIVSRYTDWASRPTLPCKIKKIVVQNYTLFASTQYCILWQWDRDMCCFGLGSEINEEITVCATCFIHRKLFAHRLNSDVC